MKDKYQEILDLIGWLVSNKQLSEFCRQTGIQKTYLSHIYNKFERDGGYVVKGSPYYNIAVIAEIKKFKKKSEK